MIVESECAREQSECAREWSDMHITCSIAIIVLQCVAGRCRALQGVAGCCRVLQGVAECCRVLQGVACIAVWCGVM